MKKYFLYSSNISYIVSSYFYRALIFVIYAYGAVISNILKEVITTAIIISSTFSIILTAQFGRRVHYKILNGIHLTDNQDNFISGINIYIIKILIALIASYSLVNEKIFDPYISFLSFTFFIFINQCNTLSTLALYEKKIINKSEIIAALYFLILLFLCLFINFNSHFFLILGFILFLVNTLRYTKDLYINFFNNMMTVPANNFGSIFSIIFIGIISVLIIYHLKLYTYDIIGTDINRWILWGSIISVLENLYYYIIFKNYFCKKWAIFFLPLISSVGYCIYDDFNFKSIIYIYLIDFLRFRLTFLQFQYNSTNKMNFKIILNFLSLLSVYLIFL